MRALIVDDIEENLYYLNVLLSGNGYEVELARHGAEALVKARLALPDIIVSDLLMPVMDGYSLLRRWKSDEKLQRIPFIVYTATYTQPEDERLALDLGADAFIVKPAEPEDFMAVVRAVQAGDYAAKAIVGAEDALSQRYTEALVRKLESKMLELVRLNSELEGDLHKRKALWETQRAILNAMPAQMALLDSSGVILEVNEAWKTFATANGLADEDFGVGSNYLAVCDTACGQSGDEAHDVGRLLRQTLSGAGGAFELDYPCHSPTERRWFRLIVTPVREQGLAGALVMHIDVTEARLSQLTSETAAERLQLAADAAAMGIWEWRVATDEHIWNDRMRQIYGLSPDQPINYQSWTSRVHPDDVNMDGMSLQKNATSAGSAYHEYRIVRDDGPRYIRAASTVLRDPDGQPISVVGINIDITEAKLAQQAAQSAAERLQLAVDAASVGIWEWRLSDGLRTWSDQMYRIYDLPVGLPITPDLMATMIHPDDFSPMGQALDSVAQDGYVNNTEFRIILADGRVRHIQASVALLRDAEGAASSLIGTNVDITERKEREDRLLEQSMLLDSINDAILVRTLDHQLIYWNRSAERIYGWRRNEVAGLRLDRLLGGNDIAALQKATRIVRKNGQWSGRLNKVAKDGRAFAVESSWTLLHDEDPSKSRILSVDIDLTDRIDLEKRLEQAQKLEAVGQLTGGVAHDFNNLLTVILGNAELLEDELADNVDLARLANMTRSAAERGAELTSRLLSFSRKQSLDPRTIDINNLVQGMEGLLRRTLGEHISIEMVCGQGLWNAFIDATQLESAVLNLCINARDAMPGGGRLTVETTNVDLDEAYVVQQAEVEPGQYVLIAVSDTGMGMDENTRARVFEPFFTTKEIGQGSGLGLSMVYGFAKQSRGHVRIYSEPGQGTTVKLYLPRADIGALAEIENRDRGTLPRGSERILVVEDEDLVRSHVTEILLGLGYDVVSVANGAAALDELHGLLKFDLLFTDIVMPGGMNGRDLADHALKIDPALRVLFTSGYTEQALIHHGRLEAGVQMLNKPYRRQELATKVRAALDGH